MILQIEECMVNEQGGRDNVCFGAIEGHWAYGTQSLWLAYGPFITDTLLESYLCAIKAITDNLMNLYCQNDCI